MSAGGPAVVAVIAVCAGAVALLAGATSLRQTVRIERFGIKAGALVKRNPGAGDDEPWPPNPLLQFTTEDGRILEIVSPAPSTRRRPLREGETVLIAYDPADPRTVVVHERQRRFLDYAFIAAGAVITVFAVVLLGIA